MWRQNLPPETGALFPPFPDDWPGLQMPGGRVQDVMHQPDHSTLFQRAQAFYSAVFIDQAAPCLGG